MTTLTPSGATGAPSASPNLPELKRLNMWVQEQNELEPGARIWGQEEWVAIREDTPMCQSAYCVAGMAIVRAGHTLSRQWDRVVCSGRTLLDNRGTNYWEIKGLAEDILGIDADTGAALFEVDNRAEDIDFFIRRVFEEAEVDYDSVEPAPDLEIEIKASEAAQRHVEHLKLINA
jgi:hypothetical protein